MLLLILVEIILFKIGIFNNLSVLLIISVSVMFMGQILLIVPFGYSYLFYLFSYFMTIGISTVNWVPRHLAKNEFSSFIILIFILLVLTVVPYKIHLLTRERIGTIPMIPVFSLPLFLILIFLGNSSNPQSTIIDFAFLVATILFIFTSILGLNKLHRIVILKVKTGIGDRATFFTKITEDLLEKYPTAKDDVDLLIYYLSSSLDSFVNGDVERSFMDAYKIAFDSNRKAFKRIYVLPENKERQKHFSEIRNNLSHARIINKKTKRDNGEEKESLRELDAVKKRLFSETLDLLRIVRYEFIEVALNVGK